MDVYMVSVGPLETPANCRHSSSLGCSVGPLMLVQSYTLFSFLLLQTAVNAYFASFSFRKYREEECREPIPGDCDPVACGGSCEAKYVRFYDFGRQSDRTFKSCACQQERICSILGMSSSNSCATYSSLGSTGQKYIRYWSMDSKDRRNRHSNRIRLRYTDRVRHRQLTNGNTRFCCRVDNDNRLALHLKSSTPLSTLVIPLTIPYLYIL